MVEAKESDVTERIIHTGGEQIQGNETRNVRDRGPRISENRVGGWSSWTTQALFAWTRTHDEPRKSWSGGYIAAGLLRADVSSDHRACAVLDCWRQGIASMYSRFARKRKLSTLSLRAAVENGSLVNAGGGGDECYKWKKGLYWCSFQ